MANYITNEQFTALWFDLKEARKDCDFYIKEINRLKKIEEAAKSLVEYQKTGAPDFIDWDTHYDRLEQAIFSSRF